MIGRSFFALCALVLFVGVVDIDAAAVSEVQYKQLRQSQIEIDELVDVSIENDNAVIDEILKILQEFFGDAAEKCLKETAKECKKYWYNPKKLINCAKDYLEAHSEECAVSKFNLQESVDESLENDNVQQIIETIKEFLRKLKVLAHAAKQCLRGTAEGCKQYWSNPKQLVQCAKDYVKEHPEECPVPKVQTDLVAAIENDSVFLEKIKELLEKLKVLALATKECVKGTIKECKQYWLNPKQLAECAKKYVKENPEVCSVSQVQSDLDVAIENDNVIIEAIKEFLKKINIFAYNIEECLRGAANECKQFLSNPKQLIQCAKDYIKEHPKECPVPKVQTDLDVSIKKDNAIVEKVKEILEKLKIIAHTAKECIKGAAKECKQYWRNPKLVVKCAKEYVKANPEVCSVSEVQTNLDVAIENDSAILETIKEFLEKVKVLAHAAKDCLKGTIKECKQYWSNPKQLVQCAKDYVKEHPEECPVLQVPTALDVDIENDNAIIDAILEILKKAFLNATENCLKEAGNECKKYWYNPKKLLQCAKDYFKENQGECAIPE